MANQIVVLNRVEAEEFDCPSPWACISIANTQDDFAEIPEENRVALLQLAFADITWIMDRYILFHDDHAHDILDFVTEYWNEIDTLLVHCDAGISRSPAVAAAIARLKFNDESEFLQEPFDPNPRVYRTLREVATGRAYTAHINRPASARKKRAMRRNCLFLPSSSMWWVKCMSMIQFWNC